MKGKGGGTDQGATNRLLIKGKREGKGGGVPEKGGGTIAKFSKSANEIPLKKDGKRGVLSSSRLRGGGGQGRNGTEKKIDVLRKNKK